MTAIGDIITGGIAGSVLFIDSNSKLAQGIGDYNTTNPNILTLLEPIYVTYTNALTTTDDEGLRITHLSSGTVGDNFGTKQTVYLQTASDGVLRTHQIRYRVVDNTPGSESSQYDWYQLISGSETNTLTLSFDGSLHWKCFYRSTNSRSPPIQEMPAVYTNNGGAMTFNLPDGTNFPGKECSFFCSSTGITINAVSGKVIHLGTSTSSASGNVSTTQVGAAIRLAADDSGNWWATSIVGTWTAA